MRQIQRQAIRVCSVIIATTAVSSAAFSAETAAPKFAPVSSNATGLMTASHSPAAGMSMAAKYTPEEVWDQLEAHSIVSLRKNQSDAQFTLGLGSANAKLSDTDSQETIDKSYNHFSGGTTIVSSMGIRFGARLEIADDPLKVKQSKPRNYSQKIKVEAQDLSFFAAAGLTSNFGIGLNMTMADHKYGDKHESTTLMSPAVMAMLDNTEIIFDIAQSNEDVLVNGHWRLGAVHRMSGETFLTGQLTRMQPYAGDDFWDLAAGMRKKTSTLGSMGTEFLFIQQHDNDAGNCAAPRKYGVRGDLDYELTGTQVVSAGARLLTGSCSYNGRNIDDFDLEFKGAFTMMF